MKKRIFRVSSSQIEEYSLVVSIPLEAPIMIVKNLDIIKAENFFISKRDKETDHEKKVEFDRARALLKWATCCNAHLVEMRNDESNHKLKFSLGFDTRENLNHFCDSLAINVYASTME